jgi:DNA gyrase inhibitor GyrI
MQREPGTERPRAVAAEGSRRREERAYVTAWVPGEVIEVDLAGLAAKRLRGGEYAIDSFRKEKEKAS